VSAAPAESNSGAIGVAFWAFERSEAESKMVGYMYILECADGSYYTGSTRDLGRRFLQHQRGEGAIHTAKRLPVKLVYCEWFDHVAAAFDREKQVQGWTRQKKEALIAGDLKRLKRLGQRRVASTDAQPP
jgi:putative endonuclease